MVTKSDKRENRRVQELAREYIRRGYNVEIEPSRKTLPAFFGNFIPDLIAHKENEHVVIEVKSRATLAETAYLSTIAEKIENEPGWRLELVVTNPSKSEKDNRATLDPYSSKQRLDEAKKLLSVGSNEAALMLGWSAAEATLRTLANFEKLPIKQAQPRHLVKLLFSRGLLTKKDFEEFDRIFLTRSHIAHGFVAPGLSKSSVRNFLDAVTRLIGSIE